LSTLDTKCFFRVYFIEMRKFNIVKLKINPVVRTLIISDIVSFSGLNLILPLFAIFFSNQIEGGNVEVAGIAYTVFLLTKSFLQFPLACFIDKAIGEVDDYNVMLLGSIITSFVPLLYLIIHSPLQLYLVQFVFGLGQALTFPSYMAIFTRHIDKHEEGTEWGFYYTAVDLAGAVAMAVGGAVAYNFGYKPFFAAVSILSFVSSGCLLLIGNQMRRR
jgi:MFS family permease